MAIQLGSAYGKVVIDSSGATRGVKESSSALKSLTTISKTVTKAIGALSAEAVILKKAFDLGRQGGEVIQTAESFEVLLKNVGAAPDLLKQLQTASRGTVSDMKLMTSTATLLAGTQDELATALASSTPELLEIAKAAQKLNPALGDTTFLYDSLARGIKRASPLILDNLGIVVRVSEANETYAKSIGKSADALTAEEQKMALLNETLRAGRVLIEQAGGSTESATDDFDRLSASVENIVNDLKARLVPTLADAASGLELILTWNKRINEALKEQEKRLRDASTSWDGYVDGMIDAAVASRRISEDEADLLRQYLEVNSQVKELTDQYGKLGTAKLVQLRLDGQISEEEFQRLSRMIELAEKAEDLRKETGLLTEAEYKGIQAAKKLTDIQDQQLALNQEMVIAARQAAEADDEAGEAAAERAQQLLELKRASEEAAEAARQAARDMVAAFFDVDLNVGDLAAQMFDIVAFKDAGGEALETYVNTVKAGLANNRITPDQAREFFKNIAVEAAAIEVDIGNIDVDEAAKKISEQFNIPLEEAKGLLEDVRGGMDLVNASDISNAINQVESLQEKKDRLVEPEDIEFNADPGDFAYTRISALDEKIRELEGVHYINFVITQTGSTDIEPPTPPGPGGQHGLNLVVPPGFPNDSFPVLASSGERVLIIPQNKRNLLESPIAGLNLLPLARRPEEGGALAGVSGGDVFDIYEDNTRVQIVEQHFHDEGSAALGMAILQTDRMKQLDASMGI